MFKNSCKFAFSFIKIKTMQKQINLVKEFHTAFNIGHSETPIADLGEAKRGGF